MAFSSTFAVALTAALLVAATTVVEGQQDCAAKLVQCANYLNSTNPSRECCNAIKEVIDTQLDCLCKLYQNPSVLSGINITQALMLPKYCNIPADISACNALAPALAPGSSTIPRPGTPGGNDNAAGGISWMGMPAFLLVLALSFLY